MIDEDLIIKTDDPTYTVDSEKGIVSDDNVLFDANTIKEQGFFMEDGKLLDSDNKPVEITKDWIDSLKGKINDDGDDNIVEFEGNKYVTDNKGNLLNEDGTVFKTKEEFDNSNSNNITLEDKDGNKLDLTINSDGDGIDKDGTVIYTKDELKELGVGNEQIINKGGVENIINSTNIKIFDENNKEITYQEGEEGIVAYVKDVYAQGARDSANDAVNNFVNSLPGLDKAIKHINMYGNLDTFNPDKLDYSNLTIDEKNTEQLKALVVADEMRMGKSKEAATKIADYYEADKALVEAGKNSLTNLKQADAQALKEANDLQVKANEEAMKNYVNYWGAYVNEEGKFVVNNVDGSVYDIILNKKQLNVGDDTYNLPDIIRRKTPDGKVTNSTLNDFFSYMFNTIPITGDNGKTEYYTEDQMTRMMKDSKRTTSEYLLESFLNFTGGDSTQFIKKQIDKEKIEAAKRIRVDSFKDKVAKAKANNKPIKGDMIDTPL